jgi:hypothetical protein
MKSLCCARDSLLFQPVPIKPPNMPSGIPALIMISEFGNAGIAILGRDKTYFH